MTEKRSPDLSAAAEFYVRRDKWIDMILERSDLHQTVRLVGVWMARRMNRNTLDTWYQISTIADRLAVKPRTILRAIKTLETEKLIVVRRDGRRGVKKAVNRYELVFPWL